MILSFFSYSFQSIKTCLKKTYHQNGFVLKYKARLKIHVTKSSVVINKFHHMYHYKGFWKWKREY